MANPTPTAGNTLSPNTPAAARLASIDAYRGFVMLLMMAEVLDFCRVASAKPGSAFWSFLCYHQSHVEWVGCSLHDMIQPSFSFLVGVALPFSLARRSREGQPQWLRTLHAFWRALILVLLGVFLRSLGQPQTYWTFEDTLTQIGLGYGFLYLLALRSTRAQWIAFAAILVAYWLAFAVYPLPGPNFDWARAAADPAWPHRLNGFAAHWNKNTNFAWAFDTWFMNLFPRAHVFYFNEGGYSTLSFIPTLGTMILGLMAGKTLRSGQTPVNKIKWLAAAGVIGLVAGASLGALGICPVVKRIWTPAWTLFSGGWCMLILGGLYAAMDLRGWKRWAFPLMVIGSNSIVAYCSAHLLEDFIADNFATHFGAGTFLLLGDAYQSLLRGGVVLLVIWLILYWLRRRNIFIRV